MTSHFYNKGHRNLLTVITLRLLKLDKLSLTDKLRATVVTCMAHRCMQTIEGEREGRGSNEGEGEGEGEGGRERGREEGREGPERSSGSLPPSSHPSLFGRAPPSLAPSLPRSLPPSNFPTLPPSLPHSRSSGSLPPSSPPSLPLILFKTL